MNAPPVLVDSAPTRAFDFEHAARSHVGRVRQVNEDSCLSLPADGIWAVADGMGGHAAGDVASRAVVEAIGTSVAASPGDHSLTRLAEVLRGCNGALRAYAAERGLGTVGSTVVVLGISGRVYEAAWAGDSRLYRLRGREFAQLSRDHSFVQMLVDSGQIRPEEAEDHPRANIITRAVGANDELEVDHVSGEVLHGDIFLLCTDGLTREVPEVEIGTILANHPPEEAASLLEAAALDNGARDNLTLVVVRCAALGQRAEETGGTVA